jgi:hypothetical protein
MARKFLIAALIASLLVNVAVLAGFLYQRTAVARTSADAIAAALGLSPAEQAALQAMRAAVFADVRQLRATATEPNAALRRLVATRAADDPELTAALARVADERARIQQRAIARLIAFRDGLSPQAQAAFRREIERPGFMLALFGVRSWGLPEAAADL